MYWLCRAILLGGQTGPAAWVQHNLQGLIRKIAQNKRHGKLEGTVRICAARFGTIALPNRASDA